MMKLSTYITRLTVALFIGFSAVANAGNDTETNSNDVILAGHDAVAYFTQGRPVEGSANFTATYNDAIYYFKNAENRNKFIAAPSDYAPQYGGFCAYGMTFGKKFEIDGKAFEIVDGKLYVNKNLKVYATWKNDISENIKKANQQWPAVKNIQANKL